MSAKASFAEISPSELQHMYSGGMSIKEVAEKIGRSYTFTRNRLLSVGSPLRSKASGTELCYADCTSRAQTIFRLKKWYAESKGGDES